LTLSTLGSYLPTVSFWGQNRRIIYDHRMLSEKDFKIRDYPSVKVYVLAIEKAVKSMSH